MGLELNLRQPHDLILGVLRELHLLQLVDILPKVAQRAPVRCDPFLCALLFDSVILQLVALLRIKLRRAEILILICGYLLSLADLLGPMLCFQSGQASVFLDHYFLLGVLPAHC